MKPWITSILMLSACTVMVPGPIGGTGGTDIDAGTGAGGGGGGGGSGSGGGGGVVADAAVGGGDAPAGNGCVNGTTAALVGDGHHNAGQNCMNNCHNHGFTFSGTLYNDAAGTAPVVGAHIILTDANNQKIDIYSQRNGNFYTSAPIAFPATALSTACPNIAHMSSQVTSADAGCNKTGCHVAGMRIHLP